MLVQNQQMCDNCVDLDKFSIDLGKVRLVFLLCIVCLFRNFLTFINQSLYDEDMVIQIDILKILGSSVSPPCIVRNVYSEPTAV